MEEKKVLLSINDLVVKFHVRSRILTAIRGISLDIYEDESIAIVGESGSGKSVFTKTFAGMLDMNGFIDNGSIIFNDDSLAETNVTMSPRGMKDIEALTEKLNSYSAYEAASPVKRQLMELESEKKRRETVSEEEEKAFETQIEDLRYERAETYNRKLTLDSSKEKTEIRELNDRLDAIDKEISTLEKNMKNAAKIRKASAAADTAYLNEYRQKKAELTAEYEKAVDAFRLTDETRQRNEILAKEVALSVGRFPALKRKAAIRKVMADIKTAMTIGEDINDENVRNAVFNDIGFRVMYRGEEDNVLKGYAIMDISKIKYANDWTQIRGKRISTVFQDPMTSLNPVLTIGKQITSIIMKHQQVSEVEARARAIELMKKVGIPNAEQRYDDYPFQYSGGMRQRIVIAIALSCQPKILICDEPTTALDVTIQAQILKLLKDLQKEFHYTIVFITHDLGVVANIADRVAVLYAGQLIELGTVEDIFYDPRHPYTWALMSSLPQLAERNTKLYSITGTPPSLYNEIVGDPFAPRNPYCLKIDTIEEPPMFKVSDTHYAKTWLLDERAPEFEKPEIIHNIHDKLKKSLNIR